MHGVAEGQEWQTLHGGGRGWLTLHQEGRWGGGISWMEGVEGEDKLLPEEYKAEKTGTRSASSTAVTPSSW